MLIVHCPIVPPSIFATKHKGRSDKNDKKIKYEKNKNTNTENLKWKNNIPFHSADFDSSLSFCRRKKIRAQAKCMKLKTRFVRSLTSSYANSHPTISIQQYWLGRHLFEIRQEKERIFSIKYLHLSLPPAILCQFLAFILRFYR